MFRAYSIRRKYGRFSAGHVSDGNARLRGREIRRIHQGYL